MKKRQRKDRENIDHRGNGSDLIRIYKLQMDVIHSVPPTYYNQDGELKRKSSPKSKIS
ncbi:MAG: hypothetical protein ACM3UT_00945 [Chloroflexota bacterium]